MKLIGDKFPEVQVETTHGTIKLPDHFAGKWFVLFSHPADFTPVCTTEFVSFQKHYDEFRELGAELIGLSVDQVFSHIKWVEWIEEKLGVKIEFPIIADHTLEVSNELGLIHPNKDTTTVRAVFIVDPNATIRAIIYYPQEIGRNIPEVVRTLRALKTFDEKKLAVPANWPNNELIGDRLIVPPAKSVEEARKRLEAAKRGEHECFDWWFCHKKVS